jgi:hypothetical protein
LAIAGEPVRLDDGVGQGLRGQTLDRISPELDDGPNVHERAFAFAPGGRLETRALGDFSAVDPNAAHT